MAAANKALPVYVGRATKEVARLVHKGILSAMYMEMVLPRRDRTGRLEGSVKIQTGGSPLEQTLVVGGGVTDVAYGGWWEFGGDNKSPRGERYRDFIREGRTIFPTIKRLRPKTDAIFERVAKKLAASATYGR